jgi:2'-5' RNA ligase
MPFAIVLLFDAKTEAAFRKIGRTLEKNRVPTCFSGEGFGPHLTLASFQDGDPERLLKVLKRTATSFAPFPLRIESIGSFPRKGVLFLAPVVTGGLLEMNSRLHGELKKDVKGFARYYFPGVWVPHCTLSFNLPPKLLLRGFEIVRKSPTGIVGKFNRLVLLEYELPKKNQSIPLRVFRSLRLSGKGR